MSSRRALPMSHPVRSLPLVVLLATILAGDLSGSGSKSANSPPPGESTAAAQHSPAGTTQSGSLSPKVVKTIHVTVDALSNRHAISAYVYGGAYPKDASTIADSGITVVRWGGNATSRYNWKAGTYNAANDWYYADFGYSEIGDADSAKYIQDVKTAGSNPLMTMVMLDWVAKNVTDGSAYSFSIAKYGAQCGVNPFNSDDGNGVKPDCSTPITG